MLLLILLLVVGSALAYLSKNNLTPVTLNFGPYMIPDVPLFYVMIACLLTGLVLSYIFYLVHAISASLKIRGKDGQISKKKHEVLDLTKRVHQLELENEKLKHSAATREDVHAL